ncbi:uncharacterized protein LOC103520451 [Diaphorina citri]|uniref:Uncharacterized protein LOC103520451 n=1 Tax=Diaphorina citri TaxID=121845 RepID=A0A1S3DL36_DIACI|nr:uncharacterized protein LOC103520451 [Diaphorina citri]
MMCQFYHLLVSSWCIQLLSCIIIHRMNTGQPDLTICSNPHYDKTAYSLKPHVQIKAILYRSPGRSQIESTGRAKVTADTTDVYKKIIIIIKFMNRGKTSTDEEYIVVDHVTDQRTKTSYRLLDPLVSK